MMKKLSSLFQLAFLALMISPALSCIDKRHKGAGAADQLNFRVDSLLQTAVANMEIPGAVAYISLDGKVLYHKAFGWKNIENEEPLLKKDIFRMASMTKGLSAVAVLPLIEEGALHLDDKVHDYIPEFGNPQILVEVLPDSGFTGRDASRDITIKQLLTHTSGIGYGFQDETYNALILKNDISEGFEDDDRSSQENIRRIAKLPLLFEPGEKYVYGLSYDVLGVIVEQVSGMRFDRYLEQRILGPLKMRNSYFVIPEKEQNRLVSVYQPVGEGAGIAGT